MKTIELKQILKQKIDAINNEKLLDWLNKFLDSESQDIIYLTDEEREEIIKGQKDYAEGRFEDNDVVNERIQKWLSEE